MKRINRCIFSVFATYCLGISTSYAREFTACYLPLSGSPIKAAFFGLDDQPGVIVEWQTTGDSKTVLTSTLRRGGAYSKVTSTTFNNKKIPELTSFTGVYQRAITATSASENAVDYLVHRTLEKGSTTEYTAEWEFKYKDLFKPASENSKGDYVSAIPMSCRTDYEDNKAEGGIRTVYTPNIPYVEQQIVDARFAKFDGNFNNVILHVEKFNMAGVNHRATITNKCYAVDAKGKTTNGVLFGWGFDIQGNLVTTLGETNLKSSLPGNKSGSGQALTSLSVDRPYCKPHRVRTGFRDLTDTITLEKDGIGWKLIEKLDSYWKKPVTFVYVDCKAADEEKKDEQVCEMPPPVGATPAQDEATQQAFRRDALLFY